MEAYAPVAPPYRPGDLIGERYEIRSLLDQGGSSEVYLAVDRVLRRSVVIKAPRAALLRDPRALARFRHEAEGLARLAHPSLVTIYDVGLDPHGPYLVEEFVPGRSLAEVLRDERRFSPARAAEIGAAAADAIAAVHDAGMLHRDLKPGNLMLTPNGGVKLLDLGIAWAADWTPPLDDGEVMGTAAYVSPELAAGRPLDARSDVYSLGVVLYEMLAGHPPFSGTSLELLAQHARRDPAPLRAARNDVPPRLASMVEHCVAKEPAQRPANARVVADELRMWWRREPKDTETISRTPTRRLPRPRRGRRLVGAAAAVTVIAMLATAPTLFARPQHAEAALRPPSNITAEGGCDGLFSYRATVAWQASSRGVDRYEVFRRSPEGRWARVAVADPRATMYEDHGLAAGRDYEYRVRAGKGHRVSAPSQPATAGTPRWCFG